MEHTKGFYKEEKMNWYWIVAVVSAFLLGWAIGIWLGASKGYDAAVQDYEERLAQQQWMQYLKQFQGGKHE
jgi:hypothetical protein